MTDVDSTRRRLPASTERAVIATEQTWLLAETVESLKSRCVALALELTSVTAERDELAAQLAAGATDSTP